MVTTGLPQIHLPGTEKFTSYKNSLQDYCSKSGVTPPKYLPEKTDTGLLGTVSFGSNYIKCKVTAASMKEADALAAYEALTQLGYLNGEEFVTQRNPLKRKDTGEAMETDAKHIKPGTTVPITSKGHLNQLCQKHKLGKPTYNTVSVPSGGASKGFFCTVHVGTASFKSMAIHNKVRDAEQDAAQVALDAANLLQEAQQSQQVVNNSSTSAATAVVKNEAGKTNGVPMKNQLQQYCQKQKLTLPTYECEHNADEKTYCALVTVNGAQYFGVSLPSKKAAEASAAEVALISLGVLQA